MQISHLITPERVGFHISISSKKRALETISEIFTDSCEGVQTNDVLDKLIERERLGTTGFGHGVAIPHGRIPNLQDAAITVLVLQQAIDFDAIDSKPVDIIFSLLVPMEATEEHLQILSQVAEMLRNPETLDLLRNAHSKEAVLNIINQWQPAEV